MIGTFIRSSHHFSRMCDYSTPKNILAIRHNSFIYGTILRLKEKNGRDIYLFFQKVNNSIDRLSAKSFAANQNDTKIIDDLFNMNYYCTYVRSFEDLKNYGSFFIALPEDFLESYENFTQSNRKILEPIFSKYISKNDDLAKGIYSICESGNFFVWAVKNIYTNRTSVMTIYRYMVWHNMYGQLSGKLKKGTITAYNSLPLIKQLGDEMSHLRSIKRGNDVVNMFNTKQKKLLKDNLTSIPLEILSKFSLLSSTKKQNFIRKVSTIEDVNEIIHLMGLTTSYHFKWDKESLKEYINNVENLDCEIKFETDTCLLVNVKDFDTIKKLARTTNWCISKNKTYWNNYMSRDSRCVQYVLFDFSKAEDDDLSIVGFTTNENEGITHAHSFTNKDLMENSSSAEVGYPQMVNGGRQGIYAVIANNEIPMSLITNFRSRFKTWTKEAFLEEFNKYVPKKSYTIFLDEDDKLVISTKNYHGIVKLFGAKYQRSFYDSYSKCEHIIFVDFSKNNCEKLLFTVVIDDTNPTNKTTIGMFDEFVTKSPKCFNKLLDHYGLPYDIICRPNTVTNRFKEALANRSIDEIDELLSDSKIKELLYSHQKNKIKTTFAQHLIDSIYHTSSSLFDLLEKHNYDLTKIMSINDYSTAIIALWTTIRGNRFPSAYRNMTELSKEEALNETKNVRNNVAIRYALARYYLLRLMLDSAETLPEKAKKELWSKIVHGTSFANNIIPLIVNEINTKIIKYVSFDKIDGAILTVIEGILNSECEENISALLDVCAANKELKAFIKNNIPHKFIQLYNNKFKENVGNESKIGFDKTKDIIDDIISSSYMFSSSFDASAYSTATF